MRTLSSLPKFKNKKLWCYDSPTNYEKKLLKSKLWKIRNSETSSLNEQSLIMTRTQAMKTVVEIMEPIQMRSEKQIRRLYCRQQQINRDRLKRGSKSKMTVVVRNERDTHLRIS